MCLLSLPMTAVRATASSLPPTAMNSTIARPRRPPPGTTSSSHHRRTRSRSRRQLARARSARAFRHHHQRARRHSAGGRALTRAHRHRVPRRRTRRRRVRRAACTRWGCLRRLQRPAALMRHGELCWYSNAAGHGPRTLARGIYTLSNALLDTAWPKTERLRAGFGDIVAATDREEMITQLLTLLRVEARPPAGALPDTGVGHASSSASSRPSSSPASGYGTRCSTVILVDDHGQLTFHERRYDAAVRTFQWRHPPRV